VARYLGLDLGTTSITALVLETDTGEVASVRTVPNTGELTSAEGRSAGRSEWDAREMVDLAQNVAREAARGTGPIAGIGVTGQMHGMVLVGDDASPLGPFIGWQDRRGEALVAGMGQTYVEQASAQAEKLGLLDRGCTPHSGYSGVSLFVQARKGALPTVPFTASFLPDYAVSVLTETRPVTDPTNAAGSGIYDVSEGSWARDLLHALEIPTSALPEIRPPSSSAGSLCAAASEAMGLHRGTPVYVACGDNQASFAGSVEDPDKSFLINVGTGGQVSARVGAYVAAGSLEARPYLDGNYLLVGAGLVGGRSYSWLRGFFSDVGRALFGVGDDAGLYETMNRLAASVPEGSAGLRCEPVFGGTRQEPERRGKWEGVGTENFTPGHMARALLEGIAEELKRTVDEMVGAGVRERPTLVGAGNGIRMNPLLREILSRTLGLPMVVPVHTEAAAYGAAMLAAVGDGAFASLREAARMVRYV